jgi:GT2 family glycosyltransferase
MNSPLVSIITVNYNGLVYTRDFLKSLRAISYTNIEIFAVDNASSQSIDPLKTEFPEVIFIESKVNLGFAGGNNLAVLQAKGKYCLLLNNDTELDPHFLEPLVQLMESNSAIGICSAKLLYFSDPTLIEFAGSNGVNLYTGRGFAIGHKDRDAAVYNSSYKTELAHGAAMMISRAVFEKIGLMAELFFLYYEPLPSSRNRIIFTRRNTRGFQKLAALLFFYLISLPKWIITYSMKGQFRLLESFVKGAIWNIFHYQIYSNTGLIIR